MSEEKKVAWEKPKLIKLEGDAADGKTAKVSEGGSGQGRGPS